MPDLHQLPLLLVVAIALVAVAASANQDVYAGAGISVATEQRSFTFPGLFARYAPYRIINGYVIGAVRDSGGSGHSLLSDGCSEHQFPDLPERNHDWIALVIRGNCTFVQKTRVAARAGAEGLLVVDSEISTRLVQMDGTYAGDDPDPIPSISMYSDDGLLLFNETGFGTDPLFATVEVTREPDVPFYSWSEVFINNAIFFAGAMMVTVTVALIMLGMQKCARRTAHAEQQRQQEEVQAVLDSMPSHPFAPPPEADQDGDSSHDQCAVCLMDYEAGEVVRELPCTHLFHKGCIDPWLLDKQTCPLCKRSVLPTDENV